MLNCCQLQPQPRLSLERICLAIDQLIWQANLFFWIVWGVLRFGPFSATLGRYF